MNMISNFALQLAVQFEQLARDARAGGRRLFSVSRLESGQGMVEYGLILALVAIGVIAVLVLLGTQVRGIFNDVTTGLTGARPTPTS